ncbi:extracellular solute-binding protein [Microbacterium sp.]|uniref:extracellular solute-binding protein n=1 Tax=Microbacterium sp. TaxID=51671 RepID=UPI0028B030B4|nr:extracellular solute-binding protein [Microbacterium sp.]
MKHRSVAVVGIVAAATLVLAGCTGGGATPAGSGSGEISGQITFQTWSLKNEKFTPYFENVIKAFEDKYPDTKVKWIDQPGDGYEDKILQQAESGELPDVINLPPEYGYSLASAGQLEDLSSASKLIDEYVAGGVEAYEYDDLDGSFAFPWYLGTELNYWNTDLLAKGGVTEPPATFEDTLEAAQKLADAGVPMFSSVPSPKMLQIVGAVDDIYKDGEFVFNTPEAAEVVDRYAELYKAGAVTPEALQGAGTANSNINNFNTGGVAWTTAGPNYIDKDLGVNAPNLLPSVAVTAGFGNPPLFVQGISVSKNSKNAATALAFAEFVTDTDNQIDFVTLAAGFFPGTVAANDDPAAFSEKPVNELQGVANQLAGAQMADAKMTGAPQYTEAMETYAKQQIALAVTGDITGQEALDKAAEYAQQNLVK